MTSLPERIAKTVRDIHDFPKKGIIFKDIAPILKDISLFGDIINFLADKYSAAGVTKIAGIESRGFLFGMPLALKMGVPFIPVRKKGKLPGETVEVSYDLEYGSACIEVQSDAISAQDKVLIIDDLLATGGTAVASINLIKKLKGAPVAVAFVLELSFLNGRENLKNSGTEIFSILRY